MILNIKPKHTLLTLLFPILFGSCDDVKPKVRENYKSESIPIPYIWQGYDMYAKDITGNGKLDVCVGQEYSLNQNVYFYDTTQVINPKPTETKNQINFNFRKAIGIGSKDFKEIKRVLETNKEFYKYLDSLKLNNYYKNK